MEIPLYTLAALLTLGGAFIALIFWPVRSSRPATTPRKELNVHRLSTRLQPDDLILIKTKLKHLPRETRFRGWHSDGRMILQTDPFARTFRRPETDLLRLLA